MDCPHCKAAIDGIISKDRFDAVYQERKDLKRQLAEATEGLTAAKEAAGGAEGLTARITELEGQLTATSGQFDTWKAVTSAGITDPDLIEAVQWAHGRLPEEGRPTLQDALAGWKADPASAPSLLRPHLTKPAAPSPVPAGETPAPAAAPAVTPPPTNNGAVPYTKAPEPIGVEAIIAMSKAEYLKEKAAGNI